MTTRRVVAFAAVLALLTSAPVARANGDPASDILLKDDVFFPYAPPTASRLQAALERLLRQTRASGYPMKVALIATANDLGAYGTYFFEPQRYADTLAHELLTIRHGRARAEQLHLLVVTPSGLYGSGLGERVDQALSPVEVDAAAQSDGLAQAAIEAVARLATANGHEVAIPPEARIRLPPRRESSERDGPSPVTFLLPVAVLVIGVLGQAAWPPDGTHGRPSPDGSP